jgi:hypothetical protein|tara:strand:+ start:1717 stop:2238 length:522 start_codon:yes stop_codon:yes gene_type:complete
MFLKTLKLKNSMEVINNFLSKKDYIDLKNLFFSNYFPWFFHERSCAFDPNSQFQFIHGFYGENKVNSKFFENLKPFISKLNPLSLYKVKANLNTKTEKTIETGRHTDINDQRFTSAVFFLNECDGYCRIDDKKYFSEDNKLIKFKSNIVHGGSTPSNVDRRIVLNVVYIEQGK